MTAIGLAGHPAGVAAEALDGKLEIHRLAPDGRAAELSGLLATVDDVHGTAERTPQAFRFVGDPEGGLAAMKKGPDMALATESRPWYRKGGGHAWLTSLLRRRSFIGDLHGHIFSTLNYARTGRAFF